MSLPRALPDFLNELKKSLSGDLRTDRYSRILYSTDASLYQVMPYGVLIPKSAEDVQACVELAAKYQIPILPRTGGTSLAGQAVNEALIIDMSRHLDQALEVNPEEHWARVQAGTVLDHLNSQIRPCGLKFGPDPASSDRAGMGGIVSNNSTGAHSILYGMTADHILECRGFLSDGTSFHFGPLNKEQLEQHHRRSGLEGKIYRKISAISQKHADIIRGGTPSHWRRSGGYNLDRFIDGGVSFNYQPDERFNLAKLICGAEGTLAVMTEIKINLAPLPQLTALALLHFDVLQEALSAIPAILEVKPSAVELLDNLGLTMCREKPEYSRLLKTFVEGYPNCILITEFYGESEEELKQKIRQLKEQLQANKINCSLVQALDKNLQQNVWTVRKAGLGLLMSIKGDYKPIPFIEDAAVPPDHLAEYINRLEKFCNGMGTKVAYYAHASAGCLHVRPLINTKAAKEIDKLPLIGAFCAELVSGYGGALSSEHGDGRSRSWLNERFFGKDLFALFRQVKKIFDPQNILNPGNIVDPNPLTENLRNSADYPGAAISTHIDFSEDQGFQRAIEMCNGAGVCRKLSAGVMCPSFMATRDEMHSTRGRANALRAAITGRLPLKEFTSKQMYEVMDLCIECKGCKVECPSSVDMAKIKLEFLAQYYKANGTPLRARLFGGIPALSRLVNGGACAGILNGILGNGFIKKQMDRFGGISVHRKMPEFAAEPFTIWFKKHRPQSNLNTSQKQVALFNDTFNTYNHPNIAIAAVELLEAAGYQVLLPGHRCCGRPMISKGLIKSARRAGLDTLNKLYPLAEKGIPIIGLEPGCLLTMRDEYLYLFPEDPRVKVVAAHCFMLEEFLFDLLNKENINLEFKRKSGEVLFHGHCHQKALTGAGPSKAVLSLPGYTVKEVDSGCCGMAGSFGYEKEHYDISMTIAERRLLPAIRQQSDETIIVAAGTSCRQQIEQGAGRPAFHPVEILRDALR